MRGLGRNITAFLSGVANILQAGDVVLILGQESSKALEVVEQGCLVGDSTKVAEKLSSRTKKGDGVPGKLQGNAGLDNLHSRNQRAKERLLLLDDGRQGVVVAAGKGRWLDD